MAMVRTDRGGAVAERRRRNGFALTSLKHMQQNRKVLFQAFKGNKPGIICRFSTSVCRANWLWLKRACWHPHKAVVTRSMGNGKVAAHDNAQEQRSHGKWYAVVEYQEMDGTPTYKVLEQQHYMSHFNYLLQLFGIF